MAPRRQPRRLHVDHREPRQTHDVDATGRVRGRDPEQLRCEAGDVAALAGGQGDVAEARLAAERLGEHGEGVVRLAEVGGVDLAGVAGEHDLGSLADTGEDRPQRRRLEVLGLVDDHHLALQRPAAQERHRLERELPAGRQLIDEVPGVGVRPVVGEGDDGVVDGGHPRIELLVEPAGQEPDVGATDRHERPVDRQTFVAAVLDDLLEPGSDGEQRLARAGPSVEGDDLDRRVEQQLEGEALLLRAGAESPCLRRAVGEQPERRRRSAGSSADCEPDRARRTRSRRPPLPRRPPRRRARRPRRGSR